MSDENTSQEDSQLRRLKEVASLLGTRKNAAQVAGVSLRQFQNYLKGASAPPDDVLARLAIATGYSFSWLVFGKGKRKKSLPLAPGTQPSREQIAQVIDAARIDGYAQLGSQLRLSFDELKALGVRISRERHAHLTAVALMAPTLLDERGGVSDSELRTQLVQEVISISMTAFADLDEKSWSWFVENLPHNILQGVALAQDVGDGVRNESLAAALRLLAMSALRLASNGGGEDVDSILDLIDGRDVGDEGRLWLWVANRAFGPASFDEIDEESIGPISTSFREMLEYASDAPTKLRFVSLTIVSIVLGVLAKAKPSRWDARARG